MFSRLAVALCLALSGLALPTAALAGRGEAKDLRQIRDRQAAVRAALGALGLDLGGDRLSFGYNGREDLVLFSAVERPAVVASLKAAYREARQLVGGLRVTGWAHLGASDTHTFTVRFAQGGTTVIEVGAELAGTRLLIWGMGRGLPPDRRPLSQLPVRLIAPEPAPPSAP